MSDPNRPLSAREEKFARAYVRLGGNGSAAAIEAGYSAAGAHVAANRLLKRPHVQAFIDQLRAGPKAVVDEMISKALTVVREERPNPQADPERAAMYAEAEKDIAAGLTRAHVVAELLENLAICMGRRSSKVTKIRRTVRKDENGLATEVYEGVQVETFSHDPAGANRAAELLLKECDRMDGGDKPPETRENSLDEVLEVFRREAGLTKH